MIHFLDNWSGSGKEKEINVLFEIWDEEVKNLKSMLSSGCVGKFVFEKGVSNKSWRTWICCRDGKIEDIKKQVRDEWRKR